MLFILLCSVICEKDELTQSMVQEPVNDVAITNKGVSCSIKNLVENVKVPAVKANVKTRSNPYSYSNYSTKAKSTTNDINELTDSEKIIYGSCGKSVNYKFNTSSGELVISGSGYMDSFYQSPWYKYKNDIQSVVIEYGVTSISAYAFSDLSNMSIVKIAASVTSINDCAFQHNQKLASIIIPDEVKYIGESAFKLCSELMYVNLSIGITSIGVSTFERCEKLSSIIIPENVTSIGSNAFFKSGLTSIYIPKNVGNIGSYAFMSCFKLEAINVSIENQAYMSKEGVLLSHNGTILYVCPCNKRGRYSIPYGVNTIEENAFYNCSELSYIYSVFCL